MKQLAAVLFLIAAATAALAQNTPVGVWKTIDDDTKQEKSLVRISESGDVVSGKIEKLLNASEQDAVCEKYSDARRGRPIVGMSIIDGLKHRGEVWEGGHILDPNNGKVYKAPMQFPTDKTELPKVSGGKAHQASSNMIFMSSLDYKGTDMVQSDGVVVFDEKSNKFQTVAKSKPYKLEME